MVPQHGRFTADTAYLTGLTASSLESRAWCFQERILSTRIVHFTEAEMVFECLSSCKCECGSFPLNQELFKANYSLLDPEHWNYDDVNIRRRWMYIHCGDVFIEKIDFSEGRPPRACRGCSTIREAYSIPVSSRNVGR
jgi:hypothetical protein